MLNFKLYLCVCAARAGKRHDASEEAAGRAGGHEAALPSNRGEGGGPTGQTGAGGDQERAQQVRWLGSEETFHVNYIINILSQR